MRYVTSLQKFIANMRFEESFVMKHIAITLPRIVRQNIFPVSILAIFCGLTLFGISGSSMSKFDEAFLGHDQGVMAGTPRQVRSDEWQVQSQMTLVQKEDGYPEFNKNIGQGQDMSIVLDVPYKGFSALFKPQNYFFFLLPFHQAFAAKWWFMSVVLCLGTYYLLELLTGKRNWLTVALSLVMVFNPFVQWWYQSITLLSIGYGIWALYLFLKMFETPPRSKRLIIYGAGLSYFVLCFALLLYPPFQISVALVLIAVASGYLLHRYQLPGRSFAEDYMKWLSVGLVALIIVSILGLFYSGHKAAIQATLHTDYPGNRNIRSGQWADNPNGETANMLHTFSAPIIFNLQREERAKYFYTNQSEAARIVAINLLLLPFTIVILARKPWKQWTLTEYLLATTTVLAIVFMVRMYTPFFNSIFRLLLLNKVENERLAIGFVLLCVLQLALLATYVFRERSIPKIYSILLAITSFLLTFNASRILLKQYPQYMQLSTAVVACLVIAIAVGMVTQKRLFALGLGIFCIFSFLSSAFINPLYTRSEPVAMTELTQQIARRFSDGKSWVVIDSGVAENVPLLAGRQAFSGVYSYPQVSLWRKVDPTGKETKTYNRYGPVIFTTFTFGNNTLFRSPQPDLVQAHFDCSIAPRLPNFGHILSTQPITDRALLQCLRSAGSVKYPKMNIYFYTYIN